MNATRAPLGREPAPVDRPGTGRPDAPRVVPDQAGARARADHAFLPAALEILETPPSPVGVALIWIIVVLAAAALLWGYFGRIDVIAVAQGKIQPTGRVKVIQPVEAGRITDLRVANGQHVAKGDILAVLDRGEVDADVAEMHASYTAARGEALRRQAALKAVATRPIDRTIAIIWPDDVPTSVKTRQNQVLAGDLGQLGAEISSLQAQIVQKERERERYEAQASALVTLIATLQERVTARSTLATSGSGSKADLINAQEALETQQTALAIARGQALETTASINVLNQSIETSYQTFVAQNNQKLAEAETLADELEQRLIKARVRQHRMALVSPFEGTISALAVTAPGQVVAAGEEIMRVVPDRIGLEIEAYVLNRDIGFVHPGEQAIVKIESLPFTRYGTINATLTAIASDAIPEPDANAQESNPAKAATSQGFAGAQRTQNLVFAATFKPDKTSLMADGGVVPLSPGMAVTVEIKTGSRRILDYIFAPLAEVASRALKER